ncbi:MAG: gamma-glutamylcyclotransferase [Chitinophagales bacterium]
MAYLYSMSGQSIFHLFVYGSLRSGFRSPVYEYISRFFALVGNARVKGKLYDMGSYPGGVPAIDDSYIIGELYKIQDESEFSWAIGQLDDYEGVNVESDEVQLYRREVTDAFINDGIIPAWIYWYNGEVSGRPVIVSGDLMEYLEKKK